MDPMIGTVTCWLAFTVRLINGVLGMAIALTVVPPGN